MPRILVLNPNSSPVITASIAEGLAPQAARTKHELICTELPDAPEGIESDADVARVTPMVQQAILSHRADAAVVACFSDPGVDLTRAALPGRAVIGIAEAAYYAAAQLATRFGVISLGPSSIARHATRLEALALLPRLAGDRDIGMSVAQGNRADSLPRILDTARMLRDRDGAGAIVLGCAGMGRHRAALQEALGLPVIDPVQAAMAAAVAALDLNYFAYTEAPEGAD